MENPIGLISTDFDGTIMSEFENPPIPVRLVETIRALQEQGTTWVINTGRDMSSLMETLGRTGIPIHPDYLVLVEREIYSLRESKYVPLEHWNTACTRDHQELFYRIQPDLPHIFKWINARFEATLYADAYSPFCLIAQNNSDADIIHAYLNEYCATVPNLVVVRNDIYARFSHAAYNKGTALAEVGRLVDVGPARTFAVGDHLNDLPMLSRQFAHLLAAPQNAIPVVKAAVLNQEGYLSPLPQGRGVADALEAYLRQAGR